MCNGCDRSSEPYAERLRRSRIKHQRADAALELFARLFKGATGYHALGTYLSDSGEVLRDEPIMIESLASNSEVNDEGRLRQLGEFAKRLARETDQESVFIAIGNTRHYVGSRK